MHFSTEKCVFNTINTGTRIWCHAKMRGRGASKNGLERKPGLFWRSGENYLRVPMVSGDAPPCHSPSYFLSLVWIASALQKMNVEKIIQAKI